MLDALLYVFVGCFVVCGCAVTRRYINVCDCDVFMVEGMSVGVNVMLSLMSVISPLPDLCGLSARTVVYVGTLGVFDLEVSLVS